HLAVVVAVAAVRVVQMALHQVIGVVAVRHGFMAAARAVLVGLVMAAAGVLGRAFAGVLLAHRQLVLFHVLALNVVQVAIVQVIDVAVMLDGGVPAAGAVLMVVVGVAGTGRHQISPSLRLGLLPGQTAPSGTAIRPHGPARSER